MIKTFKTTFVAIGLSLGVAACAGEKTSRQAVQPEVVQVAQAEKKEAVTKRVCIDRITKDGKPVLGKDGKPLQDCREMKIHKKLEGTVVPTK